jgi:hypothetical protein
MWSVKMQQVFPNLMMDAFFVPTYQISELPRGEIVVDENAVGFP